MDTKIERVNDTEVKLTCPVDKELWKKAQEKSFRKLAQNVEVPGFRKGKAPEALLRERISLQKIWNEAIEEVFPDVYREATAATKVTAARQPRLEITKISDDELEMVIDIIEVPHCEVGNYEKLGVTKEAPSVSDEEVENTIKRLLSNNADLALVEREAKMGDTVTLDFDGFLPSDDGKLTPFEGGSAKNFNLELGSHQFIPGFEEQVVGLKSNDEKDIEVTFPTNYVKELAGKKAIFKLKIHEVKEKQIPELNDESAKELGIKDVDTVEKLRNYEKETLLKQKLQESERRYYSALLEEIAKGSKFFINEEILKDEVARSEENLKKNVEAQGLTFEQYLEISGQTIEALRAKMHDDTERNFKNFLIERAISAKENLSVSDDDLDAEIKRLADQYQMKEDDVRNIINRNKNEWISSLLEKKAHDLLISKNS